MEYVGKELLEAFLKWLYEHGYLDDDFWSEGWDPIGDFLKEHYEEKQKEKS